MGTLNGLEALEDLRHEFPQATIVTFLWRRSSWRCKRRLDLIREHKTHMGRNFPSPDRTT